MDTSRVEAGRRARPDARTTPGARNGANEAPDATPCIDAITIAFVAAVPRDLNVQHYAPREAWG
jgi:hypothetical protein